MLCDTMLKAREMENVLLSIRFVQDFMELLAYNLLLMEGSTIRSFKKNKLFALSLSTWHFWQCDKILIVKQWTSIMLL